jgi:hypothetical protein
MFISENTTRQDLIEAVYASFDAIGFFADRDIDPEFADTETIRKTLIEFIESGDECAGC